MSAPAPMTVRRFRALLGATLALVALLVLLSVLRMTGVMGRGMSDALYETSLQEGAAHLENTILLIVMLVAFLFLLVWGLAACIGMLRMRQWGRSLSLWISLPSTAICLLAGAITMPALDYTVLVLSCMLWGACLALAYYSPVASEFR